MSDNSWHEFVEALRSGSPDAYQRLWDQHGEGLRRIAERRLSGDLQRRVDSEDVLQSVCRTFFRRATEGQFRLGGRDDLWRLLCAITVTKAQLHARFHLQQKRSIAREERFDSVSEPVSRAAEAPEEDVILRDQLEALMRQLDEEEQQILDLRLQHRANGEIAKRLRCSQRTVRRLLARMQSRFEHELGVVSEQAKRMEQSADSDG